MILYVLLLLEFGSVLRGELAPDMVPRRLGATFLSSGLTAGAEAQKRPVLTSTALQIAISVESPEFVNRPSIM